MLLWLYIQYNHNGFMWIWHCWQSYGVCIRKKSSYDERWWLSLSNKKKWVRIEWDDCSIKWYMRKLLLNYRQHFYAIPNAVVYSALWERTFWNDCTFMKKGLNDVNENSRKYLAPRLICRVYYTNEQLMWAGKLILSTWTNTNASKLTIAIVLLLISHKLCSV